ncbi:hypothetical protein Pyn_29502 [Prunus yedoensis var. nudiflora]|uniref:Uncharacterized protein n=1 Tax=Prunus yedoensis var. nudiflora TaxID=2094558 RepID=A0A314ZJ83_PRUYE|nr:hypothetical protein Pyn_29502 [Prunus yedoensis var. nudiflora]
MGKARVAARKRSEFLLVMLKSKSAVLERARSRRRKLERIQTSLRDLLVPSLFSCTGGLQRKYKKEHPNKQIRCCCKFILTSQIYSRFPMFRAVNFPGR